MQTLRAARNAMATRFEMVLHGENAVALRAAADQAFLEIERLHAQLSLYLPSSEISFINAHAARHAVQVEPGLFGLLLLAERIHRETAGTFDITIAPLIRCWGFMGGSGSLPGPEELAEARASVGMRHLVLDEKAFTVRFARPGMMLDLGSIGKGYALDLAMESLQEAGIANALLHGGTSTVCAMGAPAGAESWTIAIDFPTSNGQGPEPSAASPPDATNPKRPLAVVPLRNEALSVSAVHGKSFTAGGRTYGHVMDPRTGAPTQGALLAVAVLPSAAETDAFSTALLVSGLEGHERIAVLREGMRTLVVAKSPSGDDWAVATKGVAMLTPADERIKPAWTPDLAHRPS